MPPASASTSGLGPDQRQRGSKVDATTNGGTTAFCSASDTASISVTDVNDAPVLTPAAPTPAGITEDDTRQCGRRGLVLSRAPLTLMIGAAGRHRRHRSQRNGQRRLAVLHRRRYHLDGRRRCLRQFGRCCCVTRTSCALCPTRQLRQRQLRLRAWDQTSGSSGTKVDATPNGGTTAFSSASDTASISVSDVNDALTASNINYTEPFTEDTARLCAENNHRKRPG